MITCGSCGITAPNHLAGCAYYERRLYDAVPAGEIDKLTKENALLRETLSDAVVDFADIEARTRQIVPNVANAAREGRLKILDKINVPRVKDV